MQEDYTIRKAEVSDSESVARLVTELGYPSTTAEMHDRLGVLLSHPDHVLFVAQAAGTVIGLVGAYLALGLEITGRYGRLTGLIVDEGWRGRGVGRSLMGAIERWIQEQGAIQIIITSGRQRIQAHQFYRKLGYDETGYRFMKRL